MAKEVQISATELRRLCKKQDMLLTKVVMPKKDIGILFYFVSNLGETYFVKMY